MTIGTLPYIYLAPHKSHGLTDHKIMQIYKKKNYVSKESLHLSVEQKSVKQSKHKQIPSSNLDIKVIFSAV